MSFLKRTGRDGLSNNAKKKINFFRALFCFSLKKKVFFSQLKIMLNSKVVLIIIITINKIPGEKIKTNQKIMNINTH